MDKAYEYQGVRANFTLELLYDIGINVRDLKEPLIEVSNMGDLNGLYRIVAIDEKQGWVKCRKLEEVKNPKEGQE